MKEANLDDRYRVLLSRISRKHGGTSVETLRQHHGGNLLPQFEPTEKLSEVLHLLDMPSLDRLEAHYPEDGLG